MKYDCTICKRPVEHHYLKVNAKGEIVCVDCYYKVREEPLKKFERKGENE
jgi:DNA-directed RNA polymerase subunit RPC12/RpoP